MATSEAILLARSLESVIPETHVKGLTGSPADLENLDYQYLKEDFQKLLKTNDTFRFVYLLQERDGKMIFLLDGEAEDSPDYSPPGQEYLEASATTWDAFNQNISLLTEPETDRWGTWISTLTPIRDQETGQVLAVMGIDYSASQWNADLWVRMIPDIIIVLGFFVFSLALVQIWIQHNRLREYNRKLEFNEQLYHSIFDQVPVGIALSADKNHVMRPDNQEISINPMYEKILGRSKRELMDIEWPDMTCLEDLPADMEKFDQFISGKIKSYSMEKRFIRGDGSLVWTKMTVSPFLGGSSIDKLHLCIIEDITERKEFENHLQYMNEHDRLTGLYNREFLVKLLEADRERREDKKRAVIGINLSTLQILTTNYGFNYTQNVMKRIADALGDCCWDQTQLFKNYEYRFVYYLKDYQSREELEALCQEIIRVLEPILSSERVGGGIGVVEIDPGDDLEADLLLKRLLIATEKSIELYEHNLKICYYDQRFEEEILRQDKIKNLLMDIGEGRMEEKLFLCYQPILDVPTDRICCFEALARLTTEEFGGISPLEFIPLLEKTKLINPIGWKIIREALGFLYEADKRGLGKINVSINISAIQLVQEDFTARLLEMIGEMELDPSQVVLEITESVFSGDYEQINQILSKLRSQGLHIAIDDFGTGYSSLARERELDVDCLKIDKYFIDKLLETEPENAITGDIISMAHKLGHCAIAEGVEKKEQKQYLMEHGCDMIQGYLIGKPLNLETALNLLQEQNLEKVNG